jgi:hypothetical protein
MGVTTVLRTVLIAFALLICTPALSETVSVPGHIVRCKDPFLVAAAAAANDDVRFRYKHSRFDTRTLNPRQKAYKQLAEQFPDCTISFFLLEQKAEDYEVVARHGDVVCFRVEGVQEPRCVLAKQTTVRAK